MGDFQTEVRGFTTWDYVVFSSLFVVSSLIGVYHAFAGRGGSSQEFLTGGRQMTAVPVALSLTASFMSAVTVIGAPAEVYRYGAMFTLFCISYTLVIVACSEIYIPVFYRSGITSTYEYLELRFNRVVRLIGTGVYIVQTILYTGIVIYAPSLALNQVTGFTLWGSVAATGVVCTFYCTLGGLKAVVWSDVFQMVVMVGGFLMVIIQGSLVSGGLDGVWRVAEEGGRMHIWDFSPDPLRRHTFWTFLVGGTCTWLGIYGVNQSTVQRCISCRTEKHAKGALYLNLIGLWIVALCAALCGLLMYSRYATCDPWSAGFVNAPDQLMPYYVLDILGDYPGLPGVFVSCAFSGTLSTVASSINGLAAVTYEDIVNPTFGPFPGKRGALLTKGLSVLYGSACTAMAVAASYMGQVLQAALSIHGMGGGPVLGLFTLGILFPCANVKGAIAGTVAGVVMSFWIGLGALLYPPTDEQSRALPLSTQNCSRPNITTAPWDGSSTTWASTSTLAAVTAEAEYRPDLADSLYAVSYLYISTVGAITAVLVGLVVSLATGPTKGASLSPGLVRPVCDLCCFWSDKMRRLLRCGVRHGEDEPQEPEDIQVEVPEEKKQPLDTNGLDSNSASPIRQTKL
ncbi:sodium-coupled monocarboxylate transporter 2-like [Lethenteron reissneri]|uniref:sodium-coupled monocarboxylate transporter 2-like n=1 Tax=Lethenteron reissneri TaxID=7753 RepID=UPI002AB61A65|nr:sodium-coupled monocarboxylate transporter 2-like [Lethenteron reissneri]